MRQTNRLPLIEGRFMRCPRCRRKFDILAFKALEMPQEFKRDLTPVYKCPKSALDENGEHGCGFLFAPSEETIQGVFV